MEIEALAIAGHLAFSNSIGAIDFYGDFGGAIDGSDGPAAFLVVVANLHMDIEALATPLQDILDLLILLMQSIFVVSLMVQSIVLMALQHF